MRHPLFIEARWRRRVTLSLIVLAAIGAGTSPRLSAFQAAPSDIRGFVQTLIAGRESSLRALYQGSATPFLWLNQAGRPERDTYEALKLLQSAAEDGLNPEDYDQSRLDGLMSQLETDSPVPPETLAGFDVALSGAMLRYLRDLHLGRVDPRAIGLRLRVPADQHDFAALLGAAIALHQITQTAEGLRPKLAQYGALRSALSRYRALAADKTLAPERLRPPAATVHPGDAYDGTADLHRLLVALGDLPGDSPLSHPERYEGPIVDGVRRFQVRHGLEPDGILGKATIAAIRVPLTWNVRQIELSLERLRWLPHLADQRLVAVNIPMFRLWASDLALSNRAPAVSMGVIVGRALSTQTPVFVEEMREVVFRPYWNVPPSILRHEVLPKIARDPDYLRRQNMEIVNGAGDDARVVPATSDNIARLRQGTLRVRQRPGPQNSLGLIKFVFPNAENVYMHGTPAQELFGRSRRDFSHGCVRVQDPVALAEWALEDSEAWNRDRILEATAGQQSIRVSLARPIQVILFYTTAVVIPEDATIHFADDIYRHDVALDRALATRR
jgi:murein L,D-transpeptidase YcbB/YkuD